MIRTPPLRWALTFGIALIPGILAIGFGHAGVHAARSFLIPGAGLLEAQPLMAMTSVAAAAAATAAWLLWGADWLVAAIVATSMAASALWGTSDHSVPAAAEEITRQVQAHEFPLVLLFIVLAGWIRAGLVGVPGFRWLAGRKRGAIPWTLSKFSVPERCRTVALLSMAQALDDRALAAIQAPDVRARARRVGALARFRLSGYAFRIDHAHTRAALMMCGLLDAREVAEFTADARRSRLGVPCSEPTWVRPLDATLAAIALEEIQPESGQLWCAALKGPFALRRGHRCAWWWSPLGLSAGHCRDWEHALVSALAHSRGWTGNQDWAALRQRVLGAAARGCDRSDDERLVAAGRLWLNYVDDPGAREVLYRPTVTNDPMAVAIVMLAEHAGRRTQSRFVEESETS